MSSKMKIALFLLLVCILVLCNVMSCCNSSSDNVNQDPCAKIADDAVEAAFKGQSSIADSLFNRAFACDTKVAISSLSLLVDSILETDDWNSALTWSDKLIQFAETADDTVGIATGYFYFGGAQSRSGKQAEALDAYEKAISLFRKFPPTEVFASTIKSLGAVHLRLGNFQAAREAFWECRSLREKSKSLGNVSDVYVSIGNYYDELAQRDSANYWYLRGLKQAKREKDLKAHANSLYSLALNKKREGKIDTAASLMKNSFEIISRTTNREYAWTAAVNYSEMLLKLGERDSAIHYANYVRGEMGQLRANQKTAQLLIALTKVLYSVNDPTSWYRVDTTLGILDLMRIGLTVTSENRAGYYRNLFPFYNQVALWVLNDPQEEVEVLQKRMSASSRIDLSFRLVEAAKARTLLETFISSTKQETESSKRDSEASKECADSIATLLKQEILVGTVEERQRIRNIRKLLELKCNTTDYLEILRSTGLRGLEAVQSSLFTDEAILEYALTDSAIILFVIRSDSTFVRVIDTVFGKQSSPKHVGVLCDSLRAAILTRGTTEIEIIHSLGVRLGSLLLPIDLVHGQKRLIIIPEQRLSRVPFECFRIGDAYAIDSFVISYAPSANVLLHLKDAKSSMGSPLIIGTPKLGGKFSLPGSSAIVGESNLGTVNADILDSVEIEIKDVDSLLGSKSKQLVGEALTPKTFADALTENPRVIHVSAHAFADDSQPGYSFLLLGKDTVRSSVQTPLFLLATQVEQQHIPAELIFLSSCNTASGRYVGGEGVFHLQRAFVAAGAKNVIATLWTVNENPSLELARSFYSNWNSGRTFSKKNAYNNVSYISVAEALTQAKREMIKSSRFSHPSYWAPFVLMGS